MEQTNEEKTVDFKEMRWKLKLEKAKRKAKEIGDFARVVFNENKQYIIPAAGAIAVKAMKDGYKSHKRNKERREAACRKYDYRAHRWVESRRPLTAREEDQLQRYIDDGGRIRDWLLMKRLEKD